MEESNIEFNRIIKKINSFEDFYDAIGKYDKNKKGDLFEILTKYIFLLHPLYSQTTKNIWLNEEVKLSKRVNLNMPKIDKGIDLVLEHTNGHYYGIQAKFRMQRYSNISWKELATFVGQACGVCKFKGGIFVTNTYEIDEEIQRSDKIISIYGDFFENLDKSFFDNVRSYVCDKTIIINNPKMIKQHQIDFINRVTVHFDKNDRCYGNLACGSGKTLASFWIWYKLEYHSTVICVPSLYLLAQFYQEWQQECISRGINIPYLLIGSDAEIEDNLNNGLILTTDDTEIFKFVTINNYKKQQYVIITTYQSCDKLMFAGYKDGFDFCIFDEAHKTTGDLNSKFSILLHDKNVKFRKRLFMTATPRVYTNVGDKNEKVLSMDNKKWYGEEVYKYSIRDGIKDGHLCDYEIVTLLTDDEYIKKFVDDNKLVKLYEIENIPTHYIISAIMIYKAFVDGLCTHLLTYHNTIKNSKIFSTILKKIFESELKDVNILQIDGNYSMVSRAKIIKEFINDKKSILTSSRVMGEGVNIPIIDTVAFIDERKSTIDITQSVGRALRVYPNKNTARILIPFLCNDINNLDDKFYFPQLTNIIKSMSESDENVKEYFSMTDSEKKVNRIIKIQNYFSNDIKIKISSKINIDDWIKNIDIILWKKIDYFEFMFQKLNNFVNINGKFPSINSSDENEIRLASWCYGIRERKKEGKLSDQRIKKLESIKNWYWQDTSRHSNIKFDKKVELLKNWINNPNNQRIPSEYSKNKEESYLGNICKKLRSRYNNGKLTKIEINELEKLPFWYWRTSAIILSVDEWIMLMEKWVKEHKTFPSAYSSDKQEKSLASFITRVRKLNRKKKLIESQINTLENIPGWSWGKLSD